MAELTADMPSWERRLLELARQGMTEFRDPAGELLRIDPQLESAYRVCEQITAEHSRSFHFASQFLPSEKRRAIRALYAFCRTTDDIVDQPNPNADALLNDWRRRALEPGGDPQSPVSLAWADTRRRFGIPRVYAEQLIAGVAHDLQPTRYDTFEALTQYCYGVASTVGLMSMHIVGFADRTAHRYAVKLGVALQLTNILRDVGEDLQMGRLYLPRQELQQFEIHERDLAAGQVDRRWRDFMRFQIERARRLYQEAMPGIGLLHRDARFSVMAAAELYGGILRAIEANDYDVFSSRARLRTHQKLLRLPQIWLQSRSMTAAGLQQAVRR